MKMMRRLTDQQWLGRQSDRVGGDECRSELHDDDDDDDGDSTFVSSDRSSYSDGGLLYIYRSETTF